MLAPLMISVEKCGHTKVIKKKGTKKSMFHWEPVPPQAFEKMRQLIAYNTVTFTVARDYQLGVVIVQINRPIALSSRKLHSIQMRYADTEKELSVLLQP